MYTDSNKANSNSNSNRPEWGDRTTISAYGELAADPNLSADQIEALVKALNARAGREEMIVFRLKSWLLDPEACDDPKVLNAMPEAEGVFLGHVRDETEAAFKIRQNGSVHGDQWLPKSQMIVYELAEGTGEIESPQRGLGSFATGGAP
jgi:hypothetical protein